MPFSLAEKDKRITGLTMNDDATFALISNAAKERLKYLIEQVRLVAQHRIDISMKVIEYSNLSCLCLK